MPTSKYNEFLQASPSFESVVDLAADERNKNLWREYIVGPDMEKLLEVLCATLNMENPDMRRSLWLHGSYGTGKSYAALLLKHLLEEPMNIVDSFLGGNSRLAPYRNRIINARKAGDYLVIWKTGCTDTRTGGQLLLEMEAAIRIRLQEKFGDKAYLGGGSLQDAVCERIHDQKINWENVMQDTLLGEDFGTFDELKKSVESGNLSAIKKTAQVIRDNSWGLINNVETFKAWVADVISGNGLQKSGIFFIWDEFTDYLRHSDDQTVMQQISEFCKVQPLFMCFVVHKDSAWVDAIGNETYQHIADRFHSVEFHVSTDAAYNLIAGSITVRNGMMNNWLDTRSNVMRRIQPYKADLSSLDDKLSEQIEHLCPMHPMTIKLLSRVAENFAAAQRTMFRFMKDASNPGQGFVGYINKDGPDSQCCWLTPDWLWDYFFTRESDFHDKETKVPEYIRHYEENVTFVEKDEATHRVFKVAMLLLAMMSSVKGVYIGRRTNNGIAATVDCLELCLAGVMTKKEIEDKLEILESIKVLLRDEAPNGDIRLQMPYKASENDFDVRLAANDKKYTRYQMFAKEGTFSKAFEEQAWDQTDASFKRMRIAVCCAEKLSIDKRLDEIRSDLDRAPYKLGLLVVTVDSDAQAAAIQGDLERRIRSMGEPRLTIALSRAPLTAEMRTQWLKAITNGEMANDSGHTADANNRSMEARQVVANWVTSAVQGGKMIAWNSEQVMNNLYGMANLRKTMQNAVLEAQFPYAPEVLVPTATAYKAANEPSAVSGLRQTPSNSQMNNVFINLKQAGVEGITDLAILAAADGSKGARAIAAVAKLVKDRAESGQRIVLNDLWMTLQRQPYGYYDCIACGVLLGYVFSSFVGGSFTWTDYQQANFNPTEGALAKMLLTMMKGNMTTDYLSSGSIIWQK